MDEPERTLSPDFVVELRLEGSRRRRKSVEGECDYRILRKDHMGDGK